MVLESLLLIILIQIIEEMKSMFRGKNNDDVSYVTPEEFLMYVLHDLKTKPFDQINVHWRPQYSSCPFCMLNFSVYSELEENYEDSIYFFHKSGNMKKVKIGLESNIASREKDFKPKRYFDF